MILDVLTDLSVRGAEKPIMLWSVDFVRLATELLPELEKIELPSETATYRQLQQMISLLKSSKASEFEIARSLNDLSMLFLSDVPTDSAQSVQRYFHASRAFYARAQTAELFRLEREKIYYQSINQQQAYDLRLFQNEGMTYCLEFYLTLYKAILDAPTEEAKRAFIEGKEINLGFGGVPGLLEDLRQDELLIKFIYKILDTTTREKLTKAYYQFKISVTNESHIYMIVSAMKAFLYALIAAFRINGIERLSSAFFKPYGDQPKLEEIIL